jgi:WD40 repeat protein
MDRELRTYQLDGRLGSSWVSVNGKEEATNIILSAPCSALGCDAADGACPWPWHRTDMRNPQHARRQPRPRRPSLVFAPPQRPPFTEALARKLQVERVLHGHSGCVNRVAWNQDGSMLASASDDLRVRLVNSNNTSGVYANGGPGMSDAAALWNWQR